MSNLVIVAIPAEGDLVHKISSEKVPHLTLMYLGETSEDKNVTRMAEFVQHALSIHGHGPFSLKVDHRGELGDEKADVLFFESGWDAKWIKSLRGQLLQQADIRAAYRSEEQFPEWVPHLTLGYSGAPAKKLDDDRKIYAVRFDRIAVWDGNYEGPEFRLKWEENQLTETHGSIWDAPGAAHTAELGGDFLEHYGVKGMRWGVRKDTQGRNRWAPDGQSVKGDIARAALLGPAGLPATVRLARRVPNATKEAQIRRKANKLEVILELTRKATEKTKKEDLPAINKKYQGIAKTSSTVRVTNSLSRVPVQQQYRKEVQDAYLKRLHEAGDAMTNKKGTHRYTIDAKSATRWKVRPTKIEHAAGDFELEISYDDGFITDIKMVEDSLEHAMEMDEVMMLGGDFLEHYGVKGMRWGVRKREEPNAVAPQAASRVPHGDKRQTKIDVKGGENHPAAPDAIKIAQVKAKYQKSGPAALNNQELRELQERMNLEANVSRLVAPSSKVERGRRFLKSFTSANKEFNDTARTSLETVRLVKQATT